VTALTTLALLGAVSWLYRLSFTALIDDGRLPEDLRARLDVVGPAALAAVVVSGLVNAPGETRPALTVAVLAGGVAARFGGTAASVGAAIVAWSVVTALS
jgi:branched-subunit amino acid transport protein